MKENIMTKTQLFFGAFTLCFALIFAFPPWLSAEEVPQEKLVSIDYKDASLATVLRALSLSYDLNLVVTKDVRGSVSTTLTNVTVDEALEAILSVNGYMFTRRGNLIYVTPGPGVEGIDLVTESLRLKYLTTFDAQRLLGAVVSSKGDIQANEATNSLVVTDYLPNIAKVKEVLEEIDIPPTQVLIESKILDVQSKIFEAIGQTTTITHDPRGEGNDGGIFNREAKPFDESITSTLSLAETSSNISGGQWTVTTSTQNYTITSTIDALISDNKAHLLASPSITTLNGKEARIIIGEKFPYTEKTQTTTGTTETTKFVDVGTTLRVTPTVSPDGWITMVVHPEVSSVSDSTLDAGPRITTREADAVVRVRDGETIIIGGLISNQDDQTEAGIPYLKDIPIIGKAFSRRSKDLQETELTVFITPRILSAQETGLSRIREDEDMLLSLDTVGHHNLVAKLFEHAQNLEDEKSIESAYKTQSQRNQEMLNIYKLIVDSYPDDPNVDRALFNLGSIYLYYLKDLDSAGRSFKNLIRSYPDSRYKEKAVSLLKKVVDTQESNSSQLLNESLKKEM